MRTAARTHWTKTLVAWGLLGMLGMSRNLKAAESDAVPAGDATETSRARTAEEPRKDGPFSVRADPTRPRSDLFLPTLSLLLPGLGQWVAGQYGSAAIYSGVALSAREYARRVKREEHLNERLQQQEQSASGAEREMSSIDQRDDVYRKVLLGTLIYQGAGGLSAYQSFRTAAKTRQHQGQYLFLTSEESPLDLLKAPFHVSYLSRSSTYVPLAIGAILAAARAAGGPAQGEVRNRLTAADIGFTGAYSYNAGTHEEAVFRGWVMPWTTEYTGSPFWGNVGQSLLFAAAHLGSTRLPLAQLVLGYHLGSVTQKDDWRLGEAIFIHVWWDVLAFASTYSYKVADSTKAFAMAPVFWLPPLEWAF